MKKIFPLLLASLFSGVLSITPRVVAQSVTDVTPLLLPEALKSRTLPEGVDNFVSPWFPPVYSQLWFPNCQQASGVYHAYTYAINLARHDTANTPNHQMAANFTFNFYDGESQDGVSFLHSYQLIKEAGNPSITDFGDDHVVGGLYWMNGYEKYLHAMRNRIDKVYSIPVNTVEGLNLMRQWLFDHLDGSEWGGVAVYSAHPPYSEQFLPPESPFAGSKVMPRITTTPSHGMTIVGYQDSIRYDINNDGKFTNDIDINGDGKVDLGDWEIGGYKVVNSYGVEWGDSGTFFLLYSAFAQGIENWGAQNECAYAVTVKENYEPRLTAKFRISHNIRNRLSLKAGISNDTARVYPEIIREFQIFNYLGQAHLLSGSDSATNGAELEAGLDLTPLLSEIRTGQPFKVFLIADQRDLSDGQAKGIIHSFSVFSDGVEYISPDENVVIDNLERSLVSVIVNSSQPDNPSFTNEQLPPYSNNIPYSVLLEATGGTAPYKYSFSNRYQHFETDSSYHSGNMWPLQIANTRSRLAVLELPFGFPFYGKQYTKLYIGDNGTINFDSLSYPFSYIRDAQAYLKDRFCIVGGYSMSGTYYRPQGDLIMAEVRDNFVLIQWHIVSGLTGDTIMPAVKLFPSGRIEIYRPPFNGAYPSRIYTGISAGDQQNFQLWNYDQSNIHTNHCMIFEPLQPDAGFILDEDGLLTFNPATDTIAYNLNIKVTDYLGQYTEKQFSVFGQFSGDASVANDVNSNTSFLLQLNLVNHSAQSFENVEVSVGTDHPGVVMNSNSVLLPMISAGQTIAVNDLIKFSIDDRLGNKEAVSFRVSLKGSGLNQNLFIPVIITRPQINLISFSIDDGHNNRLDPGETADLDITLANVSDISLDHLQMKLVSNDSAIRVLDTAFTVPTTMKPGHYGKHTFTLNASRQAIDGSNHILNIYLTDTSGYHQQYSLTLSIGKTIVLIADVAKQSNTADTLEKYFNLMRIPSRTVNSAIVDYNATAIFLLLGSQSNSYNLDAEEGGRYAGYLSTGKSLYIEGFNYWRYGIKSILNKCLKYTAVTTPVSRFDSLAGLSDNFMAGNRIRMTAGNTVSTYTLGMLGNSKPLFESDMLVSKPIIYTKDTLYKVIGSMAEIGNMSPKYPLTMRKLVSYYCSFLGVDTSGIKPLFHASDRRVNQGDTVFFNDDSFGNITTWQWEFTGGTPSVSTEQNPKTVYTEPGTYPVKMTVWENGLNRSIVRENYIIVAETTGVVNNNTATDQLRVFPNPASDWIIVESPYQSGQVTLEWYSTDGALLGSEKRNAEKRMKVRIGFLPAGNSLLVVRQGESSKATQVTRIKY